MTTFGSVCSGIGAASVAWHPLRWRAAWLSEVDAFPRAVLAHHYPEVPNYGDMTALPALLRAGLVEAPDVFCGGTPCQAFSVAGLRRSLDDARGNLSLVFCEIADEIDDRRDTPCVVFWENVPGVLSTSDNAFGCFLAGLAGEDDPLEPPGAKWANAGVVYGPRRTVAWRTLDAQYFGLAQRRKRVFVVASAREGFDPAAILFEFEGVRRDSAPSGGAGEKATRGSAPSVVGSLQCAEGPREHGFGDFLNNQSVDAGHVLAFGGNRTRGPIDVAAALNAHASGRLDFESETFVTHALRGEGFDASEDGTGRGTPLVATQGVDIQNMNLTGNLAGTLLGEALRAGGHSGLGVLAFDTTQVTSATNRSNPQPGDPCHPLAAGAHPPAVAFDARQSDVIQCGEKTGPLDTDGHSVGVLAFSGKDYGADAGPISPTLRSMGHDGSHANGGGQVAVAFQSSQSGVRTDDAHATLDSNNGSRRHNGAVLGMQVRRLTPRECERLQGFPDDYTLIPYGRRVKPEKLDRDFLKYRLRGNPKHLTREDVDRLAADGPRYKALGNSWAVPVVRWIGRRIASQL